MPFDLSALMQPESIAVVGASPANTFGGRSVRHLRRAGYEGKVYPVNPNYQEVQGWPCYASVASVPGNIDAAVLAVPNRAVTPVLLELASKGCRVAVILSGGFGESGPEGEVLQREMLETARGNAIRLVGPNCNGVVNLLDKVVLGPTTLMEREQLLPGSTAIVTQSGSIGASVVDMAMEVGVGFSYSIAVGNSADLGIEEFLSALARDPETDRVLVIMESVRDAAALRRALDEAKAAGKLVAILKLGRSSTGSQIVATHTGALAGSWRTLEAVVRGHGAVLARDMEEQVAIARFHASYPGFAGGPIAVMSSSGGMCSLVADGLETARLDLATLTAPSEAKLEAMGYLRPLNPLDFSRIARPESRQSDFLDCLSILCEDPNVAAVLVALGLSHLITERSEYVARMREISDKPLVAYIPRGSISSEGHQILTTAGVPTFQNLESCISVLRALTPVADEQPARATAAPSVQGGVPGQTLGETRVKELLRGHGVRTPSESVAWSLAEALEQAASIGYPVVLKLHSDLGVHKSDRGLVVLSIQGPERLEAAYADLKRKAEAAGLWQGGVLVAEMIATHRGVELLVGVHRDPAFGPVCIVGSGGIWTEALDDVSVVAFPVTEAALHRAVGRLKIGAVLGGNKQRHPLDLPALWPAARAICAAFEALGPEATSLEVNPLCVLPLGDGCVALDARAVLGWRSPKSSAQERIGQDGRQRL